MQEVFQQILNNYLTAKNVSLVQHPLAKFIRTEAIEKIKSDVHITNAYKLHGSPGEGNWTDVPWIAVFDKDITLSAQRGYYIVYLFCEDMSGVYLSLNQGWTDYKNKYQKSSLANENIKKVSSFWKAILYSIQNDFSLDKIDLHSRNNVRIKGYELGNICSKFYSFDSMPTNDILISDLNALIGVYKELKGKLINRSYVLTNELILKKEHPEFTAVEAKNDALFENEARNSQFLLSQESIPDTNFIEVSKSEGRAYKIDYVKKAKVNIATGKLGELIVLQYLKDQLTKKKKIELANQIVHISENDDSAGYDIKAYSETGEIMYIEVKTTTGAIDTPFEISRNEIRFSRDHSNNYFLYRIYDLNKSKHIARFYIIRGNMETQLNLQTITYAALPYNSETV